MKPTKQKRCGACKTLFIPTRPLQAACGLECSIAIAQDREKLKRLRAAHTKADRQQNRKDKQAFNERDRSWWIKKAQYEFNKWIRTRDAGLPCISCNVTTGQFHASHYRSIGAAPEIRFSEINVHRGCAQCNSYKSGNIGEYRLGLIKKIGIEQVEWLEGPHEPKHYTIDQLREIRDKYKSLSKEM